MKDPRINSFHVFLEEIFTSPAFDVFLFHFRETMLDPTTVFALLFGSELFEDYIGHLAVASMTSSELARENDSPEKVHDRLKASISWNSVSFSIWNQTMICYFTTLDVTATEL